MQMNALILLLLLASPPGPFAPPNIAHCAHPDGSLLFTDPPCPPGAHPILWQGGDLTILKFAPVPEIPVRSQKTHRPRARMTSDDKAKCQTATNELKGLRAQRRRGYRISEEAALDREEGHHKAAKREFC
jgi:hypothetical protein